MKASLGLHTLYKESWLKFYLIAGNEKPLVLSIFHHQPIHYASTK